jgi:[ribosomal protein S18]-alanine N-acetyltransferase
MGIHARPDAPALSWVLEAAKASDLPAVVALERASYADPWSPTSFASLPDNPRVFFAVGREAGGGPVVGYAIAWHVLEEGELANLAVAKSARRKGLGLALLDAVLADAERRGTSDVFLEVRESNAAARALYSGRGFIEVGRRKKYYRTPVEDALILRRRVQLQL